MRSRKRWLIYRCRGRSFNDEGMRRVMDDTSFIFRMSAGERDDKMCSNISRGSSDNIGLIGLTVWAVEESRN